MEPTLAVPAPVVVPVTTDTEAIGAGQAGLAAAHYLQRAAIGFRVPAAGPMAVVSNDLARLRGFANVMIIGRTTAALPTGGLQGQRAVSAPLAAVAWATAPIVPGLTRLLELLSIDNEAFVSQ